MHLLYISLIFGVPTIAMYVASKHTTGDDFLTVLVGFLTIALVVAIGYAVT